MRKIISILLVLLWMFFIFVHSNQTGEESKGLSDKVIENIVVTFTDIKRDSKEMDIIKDKYSFLVRKVAHFTIYFILGILVMNMLFNFNIKYRIIYASIICILYASSDELHQLFISNRSGNIKDVLLDSSGSLIAEYLYMKFTVFKNKKL